ncbi:MAG: HAMP domain-containing histidine kinase, partial [Oscillospiraceae bacterium]|nr:HAMP domain-containing histidine kinase [Oscillospiraceae bacterium]
MADRITDQMNSLETMANDKQRLIDDLSHEMRTPLTAIRGYVEYMQAAKLTDEEYYNTLNIIDRQADRMQKLSEGVLSFTRLRNENADRTTPVNVADLLNDIAKSYSIKAERDNIYLSVSAPQYLTIKGDRLLFESLVGNLVDNALNACADTPVKRVSVSAKTQKDKAVIEIEDTGIGMS